jgi:hypothetical protein
MCRKKRGTRASPFRLKLPGSLVDGPLMLLANVCRELTSFAVTPSSVDATREPLPTTGVPASLTCFSAVFAAVWLAHPSPELSPSSRD